MLGYLDDPDATAEADRRRRLAAHRRRRQRSTSAGYLTITDRLKDMYICGGFNVYPAEVEQALARLDGVAESAVIGVPDERLGEVGMAFVLRPARCDDHRGRRARVLPGSGWPTTRCRATSSSATTLPRNATGKALKRVLREESRWAKSDVVTYEVRGSTAVVTMNRPEYRNAQNSEMTYALDAAFQRAVDDDEVKVIVLAGAGKHFSAGHDIGTPGRDIDVHYDNKAIDLVGPRRARGRRPALRPRDGGLPRACAGAGARSRSR